MLNTLGGHAARVAALVGACGLACTVIALRTRPNALEAAAAVLGAGNINTLELVATGRSFTVGQSFSPADPWPPVAIKRYTLLVNYPAGSIQQDLVRELGPTMPRGGGVPFTGELRQVHADSGAYSWNVKLADGSPNSGAAPATPCTKPEAGGTGWAGPAPESEVLCLLTIWATPQGFVKAAAANRATTRTVSGGTEVSFTLPGGHRMTGLIDEHHRVARVRAWVAQSIIGDMLVETDYADYKNYAGVQFPSHIVQKQDGFPSLDLDVTSVKADIPADIRVPDVVRNAPQQADSVGAQKIAEGVFWLTGGTHHSVAIEMRDHIVVVDLPNGESRALAVIAKAKTLIPGKPIRYVIAMHHHWDHLGGIRTGIDEGATIVTHETNRALLERAATAPHTIEPDRLAASHKPLKLETVGAEGTLTDGARTINLYTMTGFAHTDDMLLVYLPKEKVLAEADAYTPGESPTTPLMAPRAAYAAALVDNVRRLHLDISVIAPLHGMRLVDTAEVVWQASRARRP
jgi:glyoxylase-like metal-dependent hydrolase (beta-lactamase superfamily II)